MSALDFESSRAANKPAGPAPTMITSTIQNNIFLVAIYVNWTRPIAWDYE
jgi:hypothetical protein